MSGRKRKENLSCPSSWHSSIFVGIHGRLRQLLHQGLHHDDHLTQVALFNHVRFLTVMQDLMQLESALTSREHQQIYRQGAEVLEGQDPFSGSDDTDLEQTFLAASAAHQMRHPFQEFFRNVQMSLILRTQAHVLTKLRTPIHSLVQEIQRSHSNVAKYQQMWLTTIANLLVFLVNCGHLSKRDMAPSYLLPSS